MDKKDKMSQDYGRHFKQVHIPLTSFSCHHSQLPHLHRYHHSNTHMQICATNRYVIHHNSNITDTTPQTHVQATRLIHQTCAKPPIAHQSTHIFITGVFGSGLSAREPSMNSFRFLYSHFKLYICRIYNKKNKKNPRILLPGFIVYTL